MLLVYYYNCLPNSNTDVRFCSAQKLFGLLYFHSAHNKWFHSYIFHFISAETDLYVPLENDDWLIRFLRPTKFYPESARDLVSSIAITYSHL